MTHVERAWRYAHAVVAGEIVAPELVRLQCQRSLAWLEEGRYEFDEARAERVCKFISNFPHTKGAFARSGQPLTVERLHQRIQVAEFLLITQFFQKNHLYVGTVNIAIKIKNEARRFDFDTLTQNDFKEQRKNHAYAKT